MVLKIFMTFCVFVASFKSSKSAVDDICGYIETCVNDPCGCSEDSNCLVCSGGQGCSDCQPNYFLADNNEKCLSCDLLDGCLDCNKEYGCSSMGCDATRNCVRKKSSLCNIWVCDGCDPLPTNSPTDEPSNDPTNNPSNNPTDRPSDSPSMIPSREPTKQPSELPTTLEDFWERTIGTSWGGAQSFEEFMEKFDEDVIVLVEGYGQASIETVFKLAGLCDISADVAIHFIDFAPISNTMNMEHYTHCHSTQYGVFFSHTMSHSWFNEFGKIQYWSLHYLDPTPLEYILDVLNS